MTEIYKQYKENVAKVHKTCRVCLQETEFSDLGCPMSFYRQLHCLINKVGTLAVIQTVYRNYKRTR